jgi:hypothetical protein
MKIELRTNSHRRSHYDRYGQPATRIQHVVEVVIDGIPFTYDCATPESARSLVMHLSQVLGIK